MNFYRIDKNNVALFFVQGNPDKIALKTALLTENGFTVTKMASAGALKKSRSFLDLANFDRVLATQYTQELANLLKETND